jgi:hypothetical protein
MLTTYSDTINQDLLGLITVRCDIADGWLTLRDTVVLVLHHRRGVSALNAEPARFAYVAAARLMRMYVGVQFKVSAGFVRTSICRDTELNAPGSAAVGDIALTVSLHRCSRAHHHIRTLCGLDPQKSRLLHGSR